jgi:peptide/nickel transport system substrate-binding protein
MTITIGIQREPNDIAGGFAGSQAFGGAFNVKPVIHDSLVVQNERGEFQPQLAQELISVDRGTWRVNPDGTMDVTWKLRPGIKWHDGTPFTSEDIAFAVTVRKDPELPTNIQGRPDLITGVSVVDPLTLIVHWSVPYAYADQAQALEPLPKHLLGDLFQSDKSGFANSSRFTTEFIGLGPYRLVKWERGVLLQGARFDDYYQGRPPFDTVTVKVLGDPNTMVANILSGVVDVLLPDGVDIDAALEVRQRWVGTGNEVRFDPVESLMHVEIQHRVEVARPTDTFTNRTVRQALFYATDRQAVAETAVNGLAPVADSWFTPNDALRPQLESSIPQYPHDPNRALALLSQAGWTRDADGALVHQARGDRFATELWGSQGSNAQDKVVNVIASEWKALGIDLRLNFIPAARAGDREYAASYTGGLVLSPPSSEFYQDRLHSKFIRSAATNWVGKNRGGYSNPIADSIVDQLAVTIDPRQRVVLHRQLLQEMLTDVALIPLYWEVAPVLAVKGVQTHRMAGTNATWNFIGWNRD